MGGSFSYLEQEKNTWIGHSFAYDAKTRENNLKFLGSFEDGQDIFLGHREINYGGLTFQHWFVTNKDHYIEFDSPDTQMHTARVIIKAISPSSYTLEHNSKKMDSDIRDRMSHVLGLSNYSICLRNCEHVANYIFRNRWVSDQMHERGFLMDYFRSKLVPEVLRKVNTFPSTISPHQFPEGKGKKMYSFLEEHYTATHLEYYLDDREDTYNILVVGPTGAGKSHLINVFFNQPVCESDVSHKSVTQDVCFIRGRGDIYDFDTKTTRNRNIVVADTVGLCDTDWEDDKIIDLIKGRISSNIKTIDAVFIVFQAGRLLKEHVKNIRAIMDWLKYDKDDRYLNFLFVGTHADNLTDEKRLQLSKEAIEIFKLKPTGRLLGGTGDDKADKYESLVYTGFPPEDSLNEKMKNTVLTSMDRLQPLLLHPTSAKNTIDNPSRGYFNWKKSRLTVPSLSSCNIL